MSYNFHTMFGSKSLQTSILSHWTIDLPLTLIASVVVLEEMKMTVPLKVSCVYLNKAKSLKNKFVAFLFTTVQIQIHKRK